MEQFDTFMRQHFAALFLFSFVWVIANIAWRFYRRRQRGISFPPLNSVRARFHEGMASGNSDKNLFSRLGGARNCLRVTVTDDEVWVHSFFPFYLITESDLEHRIPHDAITSAQVANTSFGRRVLLDFALPDGGSRRLSLALRNPDGFLAALKGPLPLPELKRNA